MKTENTIYMYHPVIHGKLHAGDTRLASDQVALLASICANTNEYGHVHVVVGTFFDEAEAPKKTHIAITKYGQKWYPAGYDYRYLL